MSPLGADCGFPAGGCLQAWVLALCGSGGGCWVSVYTAVGGRGGWRVLVGSEAAAPPCSELRKPLQPWSPAGDGPRALVLALQQKTFQRERIWVEPIVFTESLSPVFLPLLSPWLGAGAGEGGQGR